MTPAILVCIVLIAYSLFGYPLLISILFRFRPAASPHPPSIPSSATPLSVVLCVHNASSLIDARLKNLLSCTWTGPLEVVVYCDGSTDDTAARLQSWASKGVKIIESPHQRGKASGLNAAIPTCTSPIVVLCDVRQSFAPDALENLVAPFAHPKVGAVSGCLTITPSDSGGGRGVDLYWRLESKLRQWEGQFDSVIGCTGSICAIRRDLFQSLPEDTLLDDVVIPMQIAYAGHRVLYASSAIAFDPQTLDPKVEKKRKLRTLVGNFQMIERYPEWMTPVKCRLWWQLISHKYLRLLVPWLLIAIAFLSVMAPKTSFIRLLIIAQSAAYGCAAIGLLLPHLRNRMLTVPAGFVLLQFSCLTAFFAYLKHRKNYLSLWQKPAISRST
jgi:cellulose synthase/poly-beta-1,6-N-acetylglucosamine synthase-like glycosyltransferase